MNHGITVLLTERMRAAPYGIFVTLGNSKGEDWLNRQIPALSGLEVGFVSRLLYNFC